MRKRNCKSLSLVTRFQKKGWFARNPPSYCELDDGSFPEKETRNEETTRFVRSYRVCTHRPSRSRQRCAIGSFWSHDQPCCNDCGKRSLAPLPPSSQALLPRTWPRHQSIFWQRPPRLSAPSPPLMVIEKWEAPLSGAFFGGRPVRLRLGRASSTQCIGSGGGGARSSARTMGFVNPLSYCCAAISSTSVR